MMMNRINPGDPLYIGPSNVSCFALIPIKLTGAENYGVWNRSMKISLLRKR